MYPFERFSENAKHVLTLAQGEAEQAHHHWIGTEHLLLGLMEEQHGLAAVALTNMGIQIAEVRGAISSILQSSPQIGITQFLPTSRVKRVIEIAFEEARRDNMSQVETGHILIALLEEGEGVAAHVLEDRGVTVEKARGEIAGLRSGGKTEAVGGGPSPTRRHLALSDENGKPIGIDVLFPADYSREQQDRLMTRIVQAVGGKAPPPS